MLVLLAGLTYLDRVCISVTAPLMSGELGLSRMQMSLVFSASPWLTPFSRYPPDGGATACVRGGS
jgi:hypothetical protein